MTFIIASHSRKIASGLAVLACCLVLAIGVFVQVVSLRTAVTNELDASAARLIAIRDETLSALVALNREVSPQCDETNLHRLRTRLIASRYLVDVGVIDKHYVLVCSAASGLRAASDAFDTTADVAMPDSHGEMVFTYFDRPIPGIDNDLKTTIVASGRFGVAIDPFAMFDLAQGFTSVVRFIKADGTVKLAVASTGISADQLMLLKAEHFYVGRVFEMDWQRGWFLQSYRVPDSAYVVQSAVHFQQFVQRYRINLSVWIVLAVFVGLLTYAALVPVFERRGTLEHRLKSLLVADNLLCMYQPIIDMQSGKPVGCEVLMRLRVQGQIIPPDQVIPIVQAQRLTWVLDELVVNVASTELAQHLPDVDAFKVAFNFFPSSVSTGRIPTLLNDMVNKTNHRGLQFDVEVLEQEYSDSIMHSVAAIRDMGYLISIDDFGTGFSNLGSVKLLAPDFLKIDRSFVRDMEEATVRSSLIPEIIGIGKAVGAQLIAEGIENAQQLALLQKLGVDFGQGYFISKPLPIADFARYLHSHTGQVATAA